MKPITRPVIEPVDPAARKCVGVSASGSQLAGKRIAMVTFSPYPGDPRPRRVIDALLGKGATIDLICLGSEGAPAHEVRSGIEILRVPLKHDRRGKFAYAYRYGTFIAISSAVFALRSLRRPYDLVYVHNMPDVLVLSGLLPRALGAKLILDLHDPMPELMMTIFNLSKESRSVRMIRWMEKWSIARCDSVLTVNRAMKKLLSSRSCHPDKVGVVMNSPDDTIFPFQTVRSNAIPSDDRQKPFVIMYHGSLVERNGLDVAVEALARVRKTIPRAELRVFGPSTPFLERVMESVRRENLSDAVRYLGPRRLEELVGEIEACDLGVIPNHRNIFTEINTPTRIFEYLALGKPLVAPATPGIQDYFAEDSLFFFEPGDAADLALQIQYAFSHPREAVEIARKGQQVYLKHTWQQEKETLLGRICGTLKEA